MGMGMVVIVVVIVSMVVVMIMILLCLGGDEQQAEEAGREGEKTGAGTHGI
jgi:uncharacterized membrane protein